MVMVMKCVKEDGLKEGSAERIRSRMLGEEM
jgi:hypothetical protein